MQDFSRMVEEAIRRGQEANGILATPVIAEFFEAKTNEYVRKIIKPEIDIGTMVQTVDRFRCLQELHDSLTQAVRDGLTAAERIAQQAKGDSR